MLGELLRDEEVLFSVWLTLKVAAVCLALHLITAVPLALWARSPKAPFRRTLNFVVTMPTGVKVDKVLVESGDSVQKGDTLATVDADSVKQAMLDVQEEIDELDEEIEETKDDSTSSYVTDKVSGTVTKIYAKKGKGVSKYMARKGALMIIRMDDENKTEVAVTAAVGTVSKIYVSEGDNVSAGDKLLYLADTGESSEYLRLVSGRKELAEYMQELSDFQLFLIRSRPTLTEPCRMSM